MKAHSPSPQTKIADLRWPKIGEGLAAGILILGAISVICIVLHWLYPRANLNPWLVTQAGDSLISPSLASVFTTHFFHGSSSHLWGNLAFLWPVGLLAFIIAGPYRGTAAIGYGILFAGLAQLRAGVDGIFYMGSSSIIFALLGVIILASIRKGLILTLLMVVGIGYLGDSFFDTIRPTEISVTNGISWLGHLGGLIGGFAADLKDPTEAVRVLYKSEHINEEETENLLRRVSSTAYYEEDSVDHEFPSTPESTNNQPNKNQA